MNTDEHGFHIDADKLSALQCGMKYLLLLLAAFPVFAKDWVEYDGKDGPGKGKQIVLLAGDEEYRSEEGLPMLGKILAVRHGFKCTVLFSINPADGTIDPNVQTNIPGFEKVKEADLIVMLFRFRELPDEQMKLFVDHINAGKPIIDEQLHLLVRQFAKSEQHHNQVGRADEAVRRSYKRGETHHRDSHVDACIPVQPQQKQP